MPVKQKEAKSERVRIDPPNIQESIFHVIGETGLVLNKKDQSIIDGIKKTQEEGERAKNKRKREPKDFEAAFHRATYKTIDGGYGIPASMPRNSMIAACRLAGLTMVKAKMSVFSVANAEDSVDGASLIKLTCAPPEMFIAAGILPNGSPNVSARPRFRRWACELRVRYDGDQFEEKDIANLLSRAGSQVGWGEGRWFSKNSNGMGWGSFRLATDASDWKRALKEIEELRKEIEARGA